jgi:hypothetical protein
MLITIKFLFPSQLLSSSININVSSLRKNTNIYHCHLNNELRGVRLQEKTYCNAFHQRVARQQLCKYGSTRNRGRKLCYFVDPTDMPTGWLDSDHVMCLL